MQWLIDHVDWYREPPQMELLTVHLPVPKLRGMGAAVGKSQIEKYYQEEGDGPVAETIVKHAEDQRCDIIYIGTRGKTALEKALLGSTATKVLHISDIPILLVK